MSLRRLIRSDLRCGLGRPTLARDKGHSLPQALSMSEWRRWPPDAFRALASSLPKSRRAAISFGRLKVTERLSRWHSIGPIVDKSVLRRHGFPSKNAGAICNSSRTVSARSSPLPKRPAATTRRPRRGRENVLAASMTSPLGYGRPRID